MPNTIVNTKHSSTTSQININPHVEILLPIYLSHLQPRITRHAKRKNKKTHSKEKISHQNSDMPDQSGNL